MNREKGGQNMKLNFKAVFIPALTLFIICVVVSALLAFTNALTADKIKEAAAQKEQESRKIVLSSADAFEPAGDGEYYVGTQGGETVGYVFVTESKGYGGTLRVMTGISAQGDITGVAILSNNETPGLGANATKTEFTDQYRQKARELSVIKNAAAGEGQIEALTGATISSKAVTAAVNEAVSAYDKIEK